MSYQPTKLSGYQLEINPAKFDWSAPKDIAKAPFIGGGTLGRDAGLPGDVIRFPGSIKKADLPSLMAKRKLRRIVSFESDNCVRQGYTSGLVYVWVEDIQFTENPMDPASIRYPYDVRLSVVSDAGGFLCNGDEYKRGLKFNTFLVPHSFTLTEKPVIAYPNNVSSPSQATSFTRTGEDGLIPCVANPVGSSAYYTVAEADLDKNDCQVGFDVTGHPYMKNRVFQLLGHLPTETRPGAFDVMYWNPAGAAYVKVGEWAPTVSDGNTTTDLVNQKATFEPGVNWLQDLCSGAVFWEGLTNGILVRAYLVLRRGKIHVDTYLINAGTTAIDVHGSKLDQMSQRYQQRWGSIVDAQTFPVSVATNPTTSTAISEPYQNHAIFAKGRYWVFYSNGTDGVFRTSLDLTTWTGETVFRAGITDGRFFSVFYDPVAGYVHYAYAANTLNTAMFYRRYTPNSDGTLTASAAEQTAIAATASVFYYQSMIVVDSAGNVWIFYNRWDATNGRATVTKNANTDGTWSVASGYPLTLNSSITLGNDGAVIPVVLTSGKLYALYSAATATVKGKRYDGSAWGAEETATTSNLSGKLYNASALSRGDDVHLTFLKDTANDLLYVKRSGGSGIWSAETTVAAAVGASRAPSLTLDYYTGDIYVFWRKDTTEIDYRMYDNSAAAWGSVTILISGATLPAASDALNGFQNGPIGAIYMSSNASPFTLKLTLLADDVPAGDDDRNYDGLQSAATETAATITGGIIVRNKGNDRRYRAVRNGSNWQSISQYFGPASTPITSGAYLERSWVFARKYENSADTMAEQGKEAMARVRQRQSLIRVV